MPRRFTLGDLVTRCQQRCDLENHGAISTSEWKFMISTTYAELYSLVAESGLRYFERAATFTANGADSYDEPDDHLATLGVDRVVNAQGERRPLRELMFEERYALVGRTGEAVAYEHVDDQIFFYPNPSSGTYEMAYIPQPPDLTTGLDGDYIDVVTPDGEAFLIWGVAVQAKAKEGTDIRDCERQQNESRERVRTWAVMKAFKTPRAQVAEQSEGMFYDPADWRWR